MRRVFYILALVAGMGSAVAQPGWNWPEDKATAEEKNALYSDAIQLKMYPDAIAPHTWLLENCPELNESIYIKGIKLYDELQKAEKDVSKKKEYQEKVMDLYEKRIEIYGDEGSARNLQAYKAYKYFKKDRSKYQYLYDLFQRTYETNKPEDLSPNNIVAYMDVVRIHKLSGGAVTDEEVLDIYEEIQTTLDIQLENGGKEATLNKFRDLIDQMLIQMVDVNCDFIQTNLGDKLKAEPDNLKLAKKIVGLSLGVKCTDSESFLRAAKVVQANEPDFGIAKIIAVKYVDAEDFPMAEKYFKEAADLAKTAEDKSDVYMSIARMYTKQNNKPKAREMANQALSAQSSNKDAYELIGDLYFSSFNDCKKGESKVDDRAVYLVAYDMYEKAGNSKKMAAARAQFPSIEEMFALDMTEGASISVGCWIGRSTTLRRRPE